MAELTNFHELKQHIALLASVEKTDALFISCYLNLKNSQTSWQDALNKQAQLLRGMLKGNNLADFEDTLEKTEAWLGSNLSPNAEGVALFARSTFGGGFLLPMQFSAPLPNWITAYPTPNTYYLAKLMENRHHHYWCSQWWDSVSADWLCRRSQRPVLQAASQ